jgi:hypothetical protein
MDLGAVLALVGIAIGRIVLDGEPAIRQERERPAVR